MNREKGIVFFDIDGTIIDCPEGIMVPTDKTKEAIMQLKNNGYKVGLASGRPKSFISDAILDLQFDAVVTSNGAYVESQGKEIYNKLILQSVLDEVIELCRENNMSFILEGQDVSIYEQVNEDEVVKFFNEFYIPRKKLISINEYKNEISTNKIVLFITEEKQYKLFKNKFGDTFKFMVHPNNLSWDMYTNALSKASGIKNVIEKLEISVKDSYAFGDGINDIEMFQTVAHGIAMGNANKELEKYAFDKTTSVKEEGIYVGLKKLKLI